jgi:hypothetical protein
MRGWLVPEVYTEEANMFAELVKQVDDFMSKHSQVTNLKMRNDLLDLVQKAIEHGEAKDQNKITGILVKGIKAFMGGKD